jgi:hypothetical protein
MPQKIVGPTGYYAAVDQFGNLSVSASDTLVTGSITTQNLNPTGPSAATPGSTVGLSGISGGCTIGVGVQGVYTGALTAQTSIDGINWVSLTNCFELATSNALSATIASAATGIWFVSNSACPYFRISGNAAMTGSANITLNFSDANVSQPHVMITGSLGATIDAVINSTAPANVLWSTFAPSTVTQCATTVYNQAAETVHNVKATAGNVYGFHITNVNAASTYLQFYNIATAPTLGTGVIWSVGVQANQTLMISPTPIALWQAATGIGIGLATTATGAVAPTTACPVTIFYR